MVNIEEAGTMITVFLIVAGSFMGAIASQEPLQSFGLTEDLNQLSVEQSDMQDLLDKFNSDVNQVSQSNLLSQIAYGGSAIVTGGRIIFSMLIGAFTNWTKIIDLIFLPFGEVVGLLAVPIKLVLGFIMVLTTLKFLGSVVKSLPFFGG